MTDDALRVTDELLREITDVADIAVWEFVIAGNFMRRTPNHDALYGLPWQEPWCLETFLEATSAEYRESSNATIAACLAPGGPDEYEMDFPVTWPDGSTHWLWVRGRVTVRDDDGAGQIVRGIIANIDDRKGLERRGDYMTRLYATLSACNTAAVASRSEIELFQSVCSALVRFRLATAAWIGLGEPDEVPQVVAWSGAGMEEFLADRRHVLGTQRGSETRDVATMAMSEDRVVWRRASTSVESDPVASLATHYGWLSTEAIPIRRDGVPVGVLVGYSRDESGFGDDVESLFDEIAGDLSAALRRLADERGASREKDLAEREDTRRRETLATLGAGLFSIQNRHFSYIDAASARILGYTSPLDALGRDVDEGNVVRRALRRALDTLADRSGPRSTTVVAAEGGQSTSTLLTLTRGAGETTFSGVVSVVDEVTRPS